MANETIMREFIEQIARMTMPGDRIVSSLGSYDYEANPEDVAALYRLIGEARRLAAEFRKI